MNKGDELGDYYGTPRVSKTSIDTYGRCGFLERLI